MNTRAFLSRRRFLVRWRRYWVCLGHEPFVEGLNSVEHLHGSKLNGHFLGVACDQRIVIVTQLRRAYHSVSKTVLHNGLTRMEYRCCVPKVVTLPYYEALHACVGKQDIDLRHVERIHEIKLLVIFIEDERPYSDRLLRQAQLLPLTL